MAKKKILSEDEALIQEQLRALKIEKLKVLEAEERLRSEQPWRYRWKNYKWAREFMETTNRDAFLCAANQISKSSSMIRKCIELAVNKEKWPLFWNTQPRIFFYCYPSAALGTTEVLQKWIPEFLPNGSSKKSKEFGWTLEKDGKHAHALHFNSGVSVYFKYYSQSVEHLQGSSVHAVFADEELPEHLYPELKARLLATSGIFNACFTATIGQQYLYDIIEEIGTAREKMPHAWKKVVSVFDCRFYEDGTPSHWTEEKIKRAIASCSTDNEIQRRIYGRFVRDEGVKYNGFNRKLNVCDPHPIPSDWNWYAACDLGKGGSSNHPAAIVSVAVSPDFKEARVVQGWQGTEKVTTSGDVFEYFKNNFCPPGRFYSGLFFDYANADFGIIANRNGVPFQPAEKRHEIGVPILNTLFKYGMLKIFDYPELQDLMRQLMNLGVDTDKRKAVDDLCDALRYSCAKVPWNFEDIGSANQYGVEIKKPAKIISMREESFIANREKIRSPQDNEHLSIEQELNAWAELYDY